MTTATREQVIQLRKANPCMTLEEIGRKASISRERVRQILKDEKLPTVHYERKRYCLNCDKPIPSRLHYCNRSCYNEYQVKHYTVTLVCTYCGNQFTRRIYDILEYNTRINNPLRKGKPRAGYFCNLHCWQKYRSNNGRNNNNRTMLSTPSI